MVLKLKLLPADHVSDIPLNGGGTGRNNRRRMEINSDDEEDEDFEGESDDENEGSLSEGTSTDNDNDPQDREQQFSPPTTSSPSSPFPSVLEESLPQVEAVDSSATPPLSFVGTSTPLNFAGSFSTLVPTHMSNRSIRGHVQKTPEGDTRWTMIIRYSGADRWLM